MSDVHDTHESPTRQETALLPPEYRLDMPGQMPCFFLTKRSATKALRSSPAGSVLTKLVEPDPDAPVWPGLLQRKQFSVLKIWVTKGWCPLSNTDIPPGPLNGFDFDTIAKFAIQLNQAAINQNKCRWAVVCRGVDGQFSLQTQEVPRLHRPENPHAIHPLCEHKFLMFNDAATQQRGINNRLLTGSYSPRCWAVVCLQIPDEYSNLLNIDNLMPQA